MFKTKVEDIREVKNRIEKETKVVKKQALQYVFKDILKRLKFCIDVSDNNLEQFM